MLQIQRLELQECALTSRAWGPVFALKQNICQNLKTLDLSVNNLEASNADLVPYLKFVDTAFADKMKVNLNQTHLNRLQIEFIRTKVVRGEIADISLEGNQNIDFGTIQKMHFDVERNKKFVKQTL